jgi:hypothetical protein
MIGGIQTSRSAQRTTHSLTTHPFPAILHAHLMPITPFHFGPGAAIHSMAPRHVSLLAFCAANVLMDVEPLYYMLTHQYPLHRFIHTYLGASLIAASTVFLFATTVRVANRVRLPNPFDWKNLGIGAVALGAIAGTFSHVGWPTRPPPVSSLVA